MIKINKSFFKEELKYNPIIDYINNYNFITQSEFSTIIIRFPINSVHLFELLKLIDKTKCSPKKKKKILKECLGYIRNGANYNLAYRIAKEEK